MVYFYSNFHDAHGWTLNEIDETDLEYLLDLVILRSKINNPAAETVFIDEIF